MIEKDSNFVNIMNYDAEEEDIKKAFIYNDNILNPTSVYNDIMIKENSYIYLPFSKHYYFQTKYEEIIKKENDKTNTIKININDYFFNHSDDNHSFINNINKNDFTTNFYPFHDIKTHNIILSEKKDKKTLFRKYKLNKIKLDELDIKHNEFNEDFFFDEKIFDTNINLKAALNILNKVISFTNENVIEIKAESLLGKTSIIRQIIISKFSNDKYVFDIIDSKNDYCLKAFNNFNKHTRRNISNQFTSNIVKLNVEIEENYNNKVKVMNFKTIEDINNFLSIKINEKIDREEFYNRNLNSNVSFQRKILIIDDIDYYLNIKHFKFSRLNYEEEAYYLQEIKKLIKNLNCLKKFYHNIILVNSGNSSNKITNLPILFKKYNDLGEEIPILDMINVNKYNNNFASMVNSYIPSFLTEYNFKRTIGNHKKIKFLEINDFHIERIRFEFILVNNLNYQILNFENQRKMLYKIFINSSESKIFKEFYVTSYKMESENNK